MEKRKPIDLPPDAHAKLKELAARKGLTLKAALAVYAVPAINRAHAKAFPQQQRAASEG